MKFKNLKSKGKVAFIVYSDSGSILTPMDDTRILNKHGISCIGYFLKCCYDDSLSYCGSYSGLESAKWFANEMKNIATDVDNIFEKLLESIALTAEEEKSY